MKIKTTTSKGLLAAGAMLAMMGTACPSAADTFDIDLPAGLACANFDLRITVTTNPRRVFKEFYDASGNTVRFISAGKGADLTLTNLATGATLTLRANGSVEKTALNPDGGFTSMVMGHNVIIFFPTDIPPGPSTTLYVGRVTYSVDPSGVWTLLSTAGDSTDLCAELD
jgi:hypothetical protein